MKDPVFNTIQQMLAHSPERSYKRLNPALRCVLRDCIAADLPFQPDTFRRICDELRGGRWFGDGAGSCAGEHYYSLACEVNHASACQSFEQFAQRPGVLWEETTKTPERLHVGSRFSWKGYYVTVTSMRGDSLVACTYADYRNEIEGLKVGAMVGSYNHPHTITSAQRDGKAFLLRVIPAATNHGSSVVAKRFTVRYDEIKTFRSTEKQRLKQVLDKIAKCDPKDASRLSKEISTQHFRHFQLEVIQNAFARRKDWQENQARIEVWRKGLNGAWLDTKEIYLRVIGDQVQCTNGNSVSLAAVRRALPIVIDRRRKSGTLDLPLDGHRITSLSTRGVQIGCTLVPWSEVDYLSSLIRNSTPPLITCATLWT